MKTKHPYLASATILLALTTGTAMSSAKAAAPHRVTQTLVYHQRTDLPSDHRLSGMPPALSDDGTTIAYAYRLREEGKPGEEDDYPIVAMDFDGTNAREIDRYDATGAGIVLDISPDGKRVVSTDGARIRVANAETGSAIQVLNAGRVWTVKLAGNAATGYRVFCLLQYDAFDQIRQANLQGGVYVMDEDGANLKRLAYREQLATMLGVADPLNFFLGLTDAQRGNMDVSEDGDRVVFATSGGTQVFGVNGDGSGLHIIQRDAPRFGSLCLSRDGAQVGYAQSQGSGQVNGVIRFEGGEPQPLREPGSYSELRFTTDNEWLQCGDTGILAATNGRGFRQLSATAGPSDPPSSRVVFGRPAWRLRANASPSSGLIPTVCNKWPR